MEIPKHLYNWLNEVGAIKHKSSLHTSTLDPLTVQSFENGTNFQTIVKHLNQVKVLLTQNKLDRLATPMPELNTLKEANSPSAKLYNWNIVISALSLLGVTISQDTKNLILAGDRLMLIEVLDTIYQAEKKCRRTRSISNKQLVPELPPPPPPPGSLFLDELEVDKPLDQANNCLEFILLSMCQNFNLKPKQAAGLLAQNNKYLSLIITKGLKGDSDPVLCWYQSIYTYTNALIKLIDAQPDEEALTFVLNALKAGMVAKEIEVVQWTFRLMSKVFLELSDIGKLKKAWNWFISDAGGLEATLMSCKKYGEEVLSQAVDLLVYISEFNLNELFTAHISHLLSIPDYFNMITHLLPHLTESATTKQEIISSGIINHWIELAIREADGTSLVAPNRMIALVFLSDLWLHFYEMMEDNDSLANSILALIKKSGRIDSFCIKLHVISLLFKLLEIMAEKKSHYAIIIYRTLTFMLVENYINSDIREIIQSNFKDMLSTVPSIPVGLLVDPIIKQFSGAVNYYHPFDVDFLLAISKHPRLSLKSAIQLIDIVSKIYLLDTTYSKAAGVAFTYLAARYLETEAMQDFLHKFSKLGMNMVLQIECDNVTGSEPGLVYAGIPDIELLEATNKQKRVQAINMILWILEFEESALNDRIKQEALELITIYKKNYKFESKGILYILKQLGDPNEMIMLYLQGKEPSKEAIQLEMVPYEGDEDTDPLKEPTDNSFIKEENEVNGRKSMIELQNALVAVEKKAVSKKTNFPWDRAASDIEKAKKRRMEREHKIKEEEQQKLKQVNFRAKKINKQLQIRKIEQGFIKSHSDELMFEEGSIQKYISKPEDFIPREFSEAEAQDEEMVNLILRKYSRLFKTLFSKYTGTGYVSKNHSKSTIDWLAERKEKISESEYIKLLRDHTIIDTFITKEQVRGIMKSYCLKVLKQSELTSTDYEGFKGLFCQIAYFIFSSDPHDMSHLPPVLSVMKLIEFMREMYRSSKLSTEMFEDDPGTGDKDVVRRLNAYLVNDPNTPMPDGYKRVVDRDIEMRYEVPDTAGMEISFKDCVEILDDVMFSSIGFHILEPMVEITTCYKAKGIAPKKNRIELPPIHERAVNPVKNRVKDETSQSPPRVVKPPNLSPVMKFEIAQAPLDMKETMHECALVLEDVLKSVHLKLNRVINRAPKKQEEIKTQDPLEEEKIRKAEEKRRQRRKQLEEELKKAKEEREAIIKRKEEELQREKALEEKRKKALEAKQQIDREEKQRLLKEWKEKREEEDRKAKEKQIEIQTKKEEMNKKYFEEAEKKKQLLQEWSSVKQAEEIKKKEEEEKKREEEAKIKKRMAKERKKQQEVGSKRDEDKIEILKQGVLSDKNSHRTTETPSIPISPELVSPDSHKSKGKEDNLSSSNPSNSSRSIQESSELPSPIQESKRSSNSPSQKPKKSTKVPALSSKFSSQDEDLSSDEMFSKIQDVLHSK
jgi:hypothetical protein